MDADADADADAGADADDDDDDDDDDADADDDDADDGDADDDDDNDEEEADDTGDGQEFFFRTAVDLKKKLVAPNENHLLVEFKQKNISQWNSYLIPGSSGMNSLKRFLGFLKFHYPSSIYSLPRVQAQPRPTQ